MRSTEKPCSKCGNPMTRFTQRTECSACRRGGGQTPKCLHCRERSSSSGKRGLCRLCYDVPAIRYAHGAVPKGGPWEEEQAKPARFPGCARYRCLWCLEYRCEHPLSKCSACEAEYWERAATMPDCTPEEEESLP